MRNLSQLQKVLQPLLKKITSTPLHTHFTTSRVSANSVLRARSLTGQHMMTTQQYHLHQKQITYLTVPHNQQKAYKAYATGPNVSPLMNRVKQFLHLLRNDPKALTVRIENIKGNFYVYLGILIALLGLIIAIIKGAIDLIMKSNEVQEQLKVLRDKIEKCFSPGILLPKIKILFPGQIVTLAEGKEYEYLLYPRQKELQDLKNKIANNKGEIIFITGPAGSGKSSLAFLYAHQQQSYSPFSKQLIARIRTDTLTKMYEDYCKLLEHWGVSLTDIQEDNNKILLGVQKLLKQHANWILIYDDVKDAENIAQTHSLKAIQQCAPGQIIVTAQKVPLHLHSTTVSLANGMDTQDALHLLNSFSGVHLLPPESDFTERWVKLEQPEAMLLTEHFTQATLLHDPIAIQLVKELNFPLAITTAGYYINRKNNLRSSDGSHNKYTYKEFLEKYKKRRDKLAQERGKAFKSKPVAQHTAVNITLKTLLTGEQPFKQPVGRLLLFLSLLDSYKIPRFLLEDFMKLNGNKLNGAIHELLEWGLISITYDDKSQAFYNINSIVQDEVRQIFIDSTVTMAEKLDFQKIENYEFLFRALLEQHFGDKNRSTEDLQRRPLLIPHLQVLLSYAEADSQAVQNDKAYSEQLLHAYQDVSPALILFSQNQVARDYLEKSKQICQDLYGENSIEMLQTYSLLGRCYRVLGGSDAEIENNHKLAKEYHDKAINLSNVYLSNPALGIKERNAIIDTYNNIGIFCIDEGLFNDAFSYHKQAFILGCSYLSHIQPEFSCETSVCEQMPLFTAVTHQPKDNRMVLTDTGSAIAKLAHTCNNLGIALRNMGHIRQAIAYHNLAMCLNEFIFNGYPQQQKSPETQQYIVTTIHDLALALADQGNISAAIEKHSTALNKRQQRFGIHSRHRQITTSHNDLGLAYIEAEQFQAASIHHAQAYENDKINNKPGHLFTLKSQLYLCYATARSKLPTQQLAGYISANEHTWPANLPTILLPGSNEEEAATMLKKDFDINKTKLINSQALIEMSQIEQGLKKGYGPQHFLLAELYRYRAILQLFNHSSHDAMKAKEDLLKAYCIDSKVYGAFHIKVAQDLYYLAIAAKQLNESTVDSHLNQAKAIIAEAKKNGLSEQHPFVQKLYKGKPD